MFFFVLLQPKLKFSFMKRGSFPSIHCRQRASFISKRIFRDKLLFFLSSEYIPKTQKEKQCTGLSCETCKDPLCLSTQGSSYYSQSRRRRLVCEVRDAVCCVPRTVNPRPKKSRSGDTRRPTMHVVVHGTSSHHITIKSSGINKRHDSQRRAETKRKRFCRERKRGR